MFRSRDMANVPTCSSTENTPCTSRLGANSAESPCGVAASVVNSKPQSGARPSVPVCVGPEPTRRVHLLSILNHALMDECARKKKLCLC